MSITAEMLRSVALHHNTSALASPLHEAATEIERLQQQLALKDADLLLERERVGKELGEAQRLHELDENIIRVSAEAAALQNDKLKKAEAQVARLVEALQPFANLSPDEIIPKDALQKTLQDWSRNARKALASIKEESASSPTPNASSDSQ